MGGKDHIHEFALNWCDKFKDQTTSYLELVNGDMADDCATLGFEMDCGHAFEQQYGSAASDSVALEKNHWRDYGHALTWLCYLFSLALFQPLGIRWL